MSRFWHYFVSNGRGGRQCKEMGFYGCDVPLFSSSVDRLKLRQKQGVEVWGLAANGPAREGGILPEDIILELQGQPIATLSHLDDLVERLAPLRHLDVVVLRGE